MKLLSNLKNFTQMLLLPTNSKRKAHYLYVTTLVSALSIQNIENDKFEAKLKRYWSKTPMATILKLSDQFHIEEKHLKVYELLNRVKYFEHIDVQWRLVRALYHLYKHENPLITHQMRSEIIEEAYSIATVMKDIGKSIPEYHKWLAIILDAKHGHDGLEPRVKIQISVKAHLEEALKLNPKDFTILYMLGKWCHDLSELNWFQKLVAKYTIAEAPAASHKEALVYFMRAEEVQPRTFIPNLLLLGETCMKLGQYYWAKYYLSLVVHLADRDDCKKSYVNEARRLIAELEMIAKGPFTHHHTF